jgi:cation:H+ antiporter
MGGVGAVAGLAFGVLLAFAGGGALTRGARALFAGAVAAFLAVLAAATPEFAFALRASALNLPGAAVGAVVGSLTANAFVSAMIAAGGAQDAPKGARTFAIASALAAAALIAAAYDGRVTRLEGWLMLAAAVVATAVGARRRGETRDRASKPRRPIGAAWLAVGATLLVAGTWVALDALRRLAAHRPDGDLVAGLTVLGAGAALPEIAATWTAARRGEGGQAFVDVVEGVSITLFGALGLAAVYRPLTVTEAFLGAPAVAVAVSALLLLGLALLRARAPRGALLFGLLAYGAMLIAFARSAG